MATLSESVEAILDAIVAAVQDAVDGDTDLGDEGIKAVVRGDRARPMPALPAVWIVPQTANFTQADFGDETWTMSVSIAALVKSDDPAEGGKKAQRVAALASVVARTARPDESDAKVTDVVSQSFDPTARSTERNRTLFWTDAAIRVTFTVDQ